MEKLLSIEIKTDSLKLLFGFRTVVDSQNDFIDRIFTDVRSQYINHAWRAEKAILAATNVVVYDLNFK